MGKRFICVLLVGIFFILFLLSILNVNLFAQNMIANKEELNILLKNLSIYRLNEDSWTELPKVLIEVIKVKVDESKVEVVVKDDWYKLPEYRKIRFMKLWADMCITFLSDRTDTKAKFPVIVLYDIVGIIVGRVRTEIWGEPAMVKYEFIL